MRGLHIAYRDAYSNFLTTNQSWLMGGGEAFDYEGQNWVGTICSSLPHLLLYISVVTAVHLFLFLFDRYKMQQHINSEMTQKWYHKAWSEEHTWNLYSDIITRL
jgi:hypothetical protein